MENCSGKPGVVYNFNNQCLISYQDNFHAKGDVPFVVYFDFETTAPTDNCLDPEQKKMFIVSYVMIAAFHPELKLDRIIIYRSFAHSDCNWTRTQNHLVLKRTLNHLAKLTLFNFIPSEEDCALAPEENLEPNSAGLKSS